MNPDLVKEAVSKIEHVKGDDEAAHGLEDALYEALIRSILAGTCIDVTTCCAEALKTKDIEFSRWCA